MNIIYIKEGLRIFMRSLAVRAGGFRRYRGDAGQICKKIVNDCFNGKYFQVSNGHFCEFYTRDFGWCTDSLLKLGYNKEVLKTLSYALNIFSKNKRITTSISPGGKPFDFPFYAPDSLAFLMRSLARAKANSLVKRHKKFLNREISRFHHLVIDKDKGLVRDDMNFSSMKDHSLRKSSCYDNVMAAVLAKELEQFNFLYNPFQSYDFRKAIKRNFWNGDYFLEDLSGSRVITGDSNVFPFWTGIFTSGNMLKSAISSIQKEALDRPFPLKYTRKADIREQKFIGLEFFAKNYERNTIWAHMGPLYISLVKRVDKKKFNHYYNKYRQIIEDNMNYLEVFNPDGRLYKTPFYYSDEGMLWAANFLTL